jgi:hypothetical protein
MNTYFTPLICLPPTPHMRAFHHPRRLLLSLSFHSAYTILPWVLCYCWWRTGRCTMQVGWMSRRSAWNPMNRLCFLIRTQYSPKIRMCLLKLCALRPYTNAYRISPKTRVCQYVLIIANHPNHYLLGLFTLEDGTDTLTRNVGKQLPHDAE